MSSRAPAADRPANPAAEPDPGGAASPARRRIGVAVSAAAILVAVVHAVAPDVTIDGTTIGLLGIAALPWLLPFLKSAKLPGGVEVEFREFREQVKQQLAQGVQRVEEVADRVERVVEQFSITGAATDATVKTLNAAMSAYYDYLKGVGFDMADKPSVELREDLDGGIAYYDGTQQRIFIETRYASDRDLVYRDYGHHVLMEAIQNDHLERKQEALESGLADYFLCSFKNEPVVGVRLASMMRREGKWEKPHVRNLANQRKFKRNDPLASPQELGEIWGGAFWAIRGLLGKDVTDRLLLESWKNSRARPEAFVKAAVEAAKRESGEARAADVAAIFRERGASKS